MRGNAIYRKIGVISEYQYWGAQFPLSPIKTKDVPIQFIEQHGTDYYLYLSSSIFEAYNGKIKTNVIGYVYILTGNSWTFESNINKNERYEIDTVINSNCNIRWEPR